MKKILFLLAVGVILAFTVTSCGDGGSLVNGDGKKIEQNENTMTLAGTEWDLAVFFSAEEDELKEFESFNDYFTLFFYSDSSVSSGSCIGGEYIVDYSSTAIEFTRFVLQCYILLPPDSYEMKYIRLMNRVNSFSLTEDVLKLFHSGNNDFLLFNRRR